MVDPAPGPQARSASELKAEVEAERAGQPFLAYRDATGERRLLSVGGASSVWIGRRSSTDVVIDWDPEVSGVHAQLDRGGEEWTLVDEGLSSNGSYVNGERVNGRRRLRNGDVLRFGRTTMIYRDPAGQRIPTTLLSEGALSGASLSATQRRVLIALCRPFKDSAAFAAPPSNRQIADELFLGVDAVKGHLRVLFEKFEVSDLPQNRKRLALAERALASGLISEREL